MTFEAVKDRFLLKIGDKPDNKSEEDSEIIQRIVEAYWYVCKVTGCTYKEPQLISLSAVTLTTNEHNLETALSLADGEKIFNVKSVSWDGNRLNRWNKDAIDEANRVYSGGTGNPTAFSIQEKWNATANDVVMYISFYPLVSAANAEDCYVSWFKRPVAPTTSNWDEVYPEFAEEYHPIIAEKAALEFLKDIGSARFDLMRWRDVQDKISTMKQVYTSKITRGEKPVSTLGYRRSEPRWYGENG
jgi:hypothetical protein